VHQVKKLRDMAKAGIDLKSIEWSQHWGGFHDNQSFESAFDVHGSLN
jgi:hypothetical protein